MRIKNLLIATTLFVSSANLVPVAPTVINAATTKQHVTIKNTTLTKQGYVVGLKSDAVEKVYVGKSNYKKLTKSVTPLKRAKTVKPKIVRKVKFRIEKVASMKGNAFGAPEYLIASKNKKYSTWTTQADLQYYYWNSKSMKNVTKYLKRIANRYTKKENDPRYGSLKDKRNLKDFNSAIKAAKKLPASQKKFVLTSLGQLKKTGNINVYGKNILVFAIQ